VGFKLLLIFLPYPPPKVIELSSVHQNMF
jgi:hypothetical protein